MTKIRKYRIKTKQEFLSEFGMLWRDKVRFTFATEMDYLIGKKINNELYEDIIKIGRGTIRSQLYSFDISIDMITPMLDMVVNKDGSVKYV